jgi:ABC-2 type transport system ATP-binding protein
MLEVINLNKKFGNQIVLNQINFKLESGKVYGLVGRNGAGKTTLFNCIAGIETFNGEVKYNNGKLKNNLSYLPSELYYFNYITGIEYLEFLCKARNKSNIDFKKYNIFDLPLDKYISEYSTGMKKKIALMGVLFQQSHVIILDEPFNGLDLESSEILSKILLELKSLNKIVFLSSHIFSTLTNICDEIILLEQGTIIKTVLPNQYENLNQEFSKVYIEKVYKIKTLL